MWEYSNYEHQKNDEKHGITEKEIEIIKENVNNILSSYNGFHVTNVDGPGAILPWKGRFKDLVNNLDIRIYISRNNINKRNE